MNDISVSGELRGGSMMFVKQHKIFYCPSNAGARLIVEDIAKCTTNAKVIKAELEPLRRRKSRQSFMNPCLGKIRGMSMMVAGAVKCNEQLGAVKNAARNRVGSILRAANDTGIGCVDKAVRRKDHVKGALSARVFKDLSLADVTLGGASFMIYLNSKTWEGNDGVTLSAMVERALTRGVHIVLVHENVVRFGGCPFSVFFNTTPRDLIDKGLYGPIAQPWHDGTFRNISIRLTAKQMGARRTMRGDVALSKAGSLKKMMADEIINEKERVTSFVMRRQNSSRDLDERGASMPEQQRNSASHSTATGRRRMSNAANETLVVAKQASRGRRMSLQEAGSSRSRRRLSLDSSALKQRAVPESTISYI